MRLDVTQKQFAMLYDVCVEHMQECIPHTEQKLGKHIICTPAPRDDNDREFIVLVQMLEAERATQEV